MTKANVDNWFSRNKSAGIFRDVATGLGRGAIDPAKYFGGGRIALPEARAKTIEDNEISNSANTAANWFVGSALAGAGLAGIGALIKRWQRRTKEDEINELRKRVGPVLSLSPGPRRSKAAQIAPYTETQLSQLGVAPPTGSAKPKMRVPDMSSGDGPSWKNPAAFAGAAGGGLLGYLLLRNFLDSREEASLKNDRVRAEQSFSRAVSHALKPQGLRLTAKRASASQELTDEEVVMSALDDLAREQIDRAKKQASSLLGKTGYWAALLGLLPTAGIGLNLGWRYGSASNPYTKQLRDIKTRHLLQAVNTPSSPILTTANLDGLRDDDEEEEELKDDELL